MRALVGLYAIVIKAWCALRARLLWLLGRDDDADNAD